MKWNEMIFKNKGREEGDQINKDDDDVNMIFCSSKKKAIKPNTQKVKFP